MRHPLLMDAVMTMRNAACLAEFALSPLFTRQWSSIYEALQDSRPDRKKLMVLYIKQLEQQVPAAEHVLVAIDFCSMGQTRCQNIGRQNIAISSGSNRRTRIQHNCLDTRSTGELGTTVVT